LPWTEQRTLSAPLGYRLAAAAAVISGVAFTAGYAWLSARQAARMELALHMTQAVLAREQRLSALGGLAAAAAHELGTPLATIAVVAKELAREGPDENVRDDARLLLSQTDRCREILRRLTEAPEAEDAVHARMSLVQLLNEVIEPHTGAPVRVEAVVTGAPGAAAPYVRRMPEVLRAMTSLVDNAVDFAASDVLITARFDQETVAIEVRDDGPGFAPDVLGKLGQPYVTSRPSGENSRSHHSGMGLGFFIAKTLLERTGATVEFKNGKSGGAVVAARWRREQVEATPIA
jgi:two-component system sensor histidine kinase RegB